jgi:pimeloyl-ACP methyl ester carboxylesterase
MLKLLAGAGALAAGATVYQEMAEARDRQTYGPPGQLVDVGGRHLHYQTEGSGSPTVVIETGAGTLARSWAPIVSRLAEQTTVVTYDRAGYGWSDGAGLGRRTGSDVADDLITMLETAAIEPPYVVVGHSLGGLYARTFAVSNREVTAGLVLVDATHEDVLTRIRERLGAKGLLLQAASALLMAGVPRSVVRMGIQTGAMRSMARAMMGGDTDEDFALHAALYLTGKFRWASLSEQIGVPATASYLRDHRHLGDLPIVVVTAAEPDPSSTALTARFRPEWLEMQSDLATLSTNAMHVIATSGGHFVYRDDPDTVCNAIGRLIDSVRAPRPLPA